MNLTVKQERFAQAYVETGNASEAYRQAYDVGENTKKETVWENASRTLADAKVAARVMELQEEHRERHNVTVDSISAELDEARDLANFMFKPDTMVLASNSKAKLHGLITDKTDNTNTHDVGGSLKSLMQKIDGRTRSL